MPESSSNVVPESSSNVAPDSGAGLVPNFITHQELEPPVDELEVSKKEYEDTMAVNQKEEDETRVEFDPQEVEQVSKSHKEAMKKHYDRCQSYKLTKRNRLTKAEELKEKEE